MTDLAVATRQREQWIDITAQVQEVASRAGADGVCVVFVPHTTAGVTIQENADPDVVTDSLLALDRAVPADLPYRHGEGNSTAHVKSVLTGSSVMIPMRAGHLELGTWQAIYFCEFDGPRRRRCVVQLLTQGE